MRTIWLEPDGAAVGIIDQTLLPHELVTARLATLDEAAHAIRFLGVKHVVPMHYATFPMLTGRPEQLRQEAKDIAGLEIHVLKPGESL